MLARGCTKLVTTGLLVKIQQVMSHYSTSSVTELRYLAYCETNFCIPVATARGWNKSVPEHPAELILQPFRHFTYVKTHSPTIPSLYLRLSSFSNPSVATPTSQFILQPFFDSPTSQALQLIHLGSRPWFYRHIT